MKNQKFFLLAGVFVLVLVLAAVGYRSLSTQYEPEGSQSGITQEQPQQSETPEVAEDTEEVEQEPVMAPDFTVLDGEGNAVHLSDFAGKPVVINFWATWCGPCKSELPAFDEMYQTYGEDMVFMMLNVTDGARDTVDSVKAFVEENGFSFPVYYDTTLMASAMYGASSIPLTVFILPDGTLAGGYRGAISGETLEQSIQIVLSMANAARQAEEEPAVSFEGTTFSYGEHSYDITERRGAINSILSAVRVGDKIVVEGHTGPKHAVYCIYDIAEEAFEKDITGANLTWHSEDITTAVYSFWSGVYAYDGTLLKDYDLAENEFIYGLTYGADHTVLHVTIVCDDGTERRDTIYL